MKKVRFYNGFIGKQEDQGEKKGKSMTKSYDQEKNKGTKKQSPTKDHDSEYNKKHEKAEHPRRIWPTDSENHKKKGPKI